MAPLSLKGLRGSIPAMVTPMKPDGSVDYDCITKLVEWHFEEGSVALVILGTTGESPTVTSEEFPKVVKAAVAAAKGRFPIIAGTGTNCTASSIEKQKIGKECGADASLIVTPYYNKPTQEGLFQHYSAIVKAVPGFPIIMYNVPGRTQCDMLPETVGRLSKLPEIIGVKEATGKIDRVASIKALVPEDFLLYSGDDSTTLDFIFAGGHGCITVSGNVCPKKNQKMVMAGVNGQKEEAIKLNTELMHIHKKLFVEANPTPTKWILNHMGKIPAGIRLPLLPLTEEFHQVVLDAYKAASV
eukprot:Platyproteum_vivax@DN2108_c0_g1_i1.p1